MKLLFLLKAVYVLSVFAYQFLFFMESRSWAKNKKFLPEYLFIIIIGFVPIINTIGVIKSLKDYLK